MINKFKKSSLYSLFESKSFRLHFCLFIVFNVLLYGWMMFAHNLVSFQNQNYTYSSHHYKADSRIENPDSFNLLDALAQYDAQFYLQIADDGYSVNDEDWSNKTTDSKISYAFPPLYPILISALNIFTNSIVVSAFVVTQITLLASFVAVYWLISRFKNELLAQKTVWLLYLFPFSIFFRSYFSEALFIIILVLLLDSLLKQKRIISSIAVGLLTITRLVGVSLILLWFAKLVIDTKLLRVRVKQAVMYALVSLVPLVGWMAFNYISAGSALFFIDVREAWLKTQIPPISTLEPVTNFFSLHLHMFHSSKIDILMLCFFGILLYFSRNWLPRSWWWVAFVIWITPILTSDTMSASRYQMVNLPLFIYLSHILKGKVYKASIAICLLGLLLVSVLFVNWFWIG